MNLRKKAKRKRSGKGGSRCIVSPFFFILMYTSLKRTVVGPAVEAFGFQRIIYGSSSSVPGNNSDDWYEIAQESLAELGVEQDGLDAVFGTNASLVYGGA
jgi:predicted TIM-barrel fold metal-dependent hydrolase